MVAVEKKAIKVTVWQDNSEDNNPLAWDNPLDIYYSARSRYILGNETSSDFAETLMDKLNYSEQYRERMYRQHGTGRGLFDFLVERLNKAGKYFVVPVYAYIHGNISLSTTPFSCRWDSGMSGFAIVDIKEYKKNWDVKRISKEQIETWVEGMIETFGQYIEGDVYSLVIEDADTDETIDCVGSLFGTDFANWIDVLDIDPNDYGYTNEELIGLIEQAHSEIKY